MDSRVLPTRFCQSDPGDMVLIRSAANVVSRSEGHLKGHPNTDAVGLELAIKLQGVRHIIVCGHADCKVSIYLQYLSCFILVNVYFFLFVISFFSSSLSFSWIVSLGPTVEYI